MAERSSIIQKHTSGETPRCVWYAILPARRLCSQVLLAPAAPAAPVAAAAGTTPVAPVASVGVAAGTAPVVAPATRSSRDVLVDASVYLKPTELVDVALNVLARLAPSLNLGVRELGHKDLLDTIGANNCRK